MVDSNKVFNILYLEDDLNIKPYDITLGDKYTIHLHVARNCDEARTLSKDNKFDAFMLDIEIENSRETGIQFAEELRADSAYYSVPIIFLSMHSHYSSKLLSHIKNSSFLSKPASQSKITEQVLLMLNVREYTTKHYSYEPLIISNDYNTKLEIYPNKISFIEAVGKEITFQYIDGKTVNLICKYGTFKSILSQIKEKEIGCLRQIHRSVIININQIRNVELEKHIGYVYLFADKTPKPLGIKYRDNIVEFMED